MSNSQEELLIPMNDLSTNDWENLNPDYLLDFCGEFKDSITDDKLALFNSPITDNEDKDSINNSSKDHFEDDMAGMAEFMQDPYVQANFLSCDINEIGTNIKRKFNDLNEIESEQEKSQVKKSIQRIKKVVMKTFVPNDTVNLSKNSDVCCNSPGQEKLRKDILKSFFNSFNSAGDMYNLGPLIGHISETCTLVTNDLPEPLNGRCCIMALFAILLEYYPDGTYELLKISNKVNTYTGFYSFIGTPVFKLSIETLVDSVKFYMRQQAVPCNIETIQDGLEFLWSPENSSTPTNNNQKHAKSSKGDYNGKFKKSIAFTYNEDNLITMIVISNSV
jgi:hypothetical protein